MKLEENEAEEKAWLDLLNSLISIECHSFGNESR